MTGVLFGINALGVYVFKQSSWAPELALDLQGGTQIILSAETEDGAAPSPEQLDQAAAIIRQRVDASGVSEAEISTQGTNNIEVLIPGSTLDKATLERLKSSSKLEFRAVILAGTPSPDSIGTPSPTDSATPTPTPTPTPTASETPNPEPTDGSDPNWVTPALQSEFDAFSCDQIDAVKANIAPADEPLITCDSDGAVKYLLGPVEVDGAQITDATAGTRQGNNGVNTGQWVVNLKFTADARGVSEQEVYDEIAARKPLGRIPADEACAGAVLFLLSRLASEVTGAVLDVNGGEYMPA